MGRARRQIRADGDRWSARLARGPSPGEPQVVLFFCLTTDQRPYRVVEVPRERIPDDDALLALPAAELEELFESSGSMDFPRNYHTRTPAGS